MTATYKATEQYLDDEDRRAMEEVIDVGYRAFVHAHDFEMPNVTVEAALKALEDLRNHLRGKYYGG